MPRRGGPGRSCSALARAIVLQGAMASGSSFWAALDPDVVRRRARHALRPWPGGSRGSRGSSSVPSRSPVSRTAPPAVAPAARAVAPCRPSAGTRASSPRAACSSPRTSCTSLAMAAWLGGIAVLVLALRSATAGGSSARTGRGCWSATVVALLRAGHRRGRRRSCSPAILQSIVDMERFGQLLDTRFGRAVLDQVGALRWRSSALGCVNRSRLLPRLRRGRGVIACRRRPAAAELRRARPGRRSSPSPARWPATRPRPPSPPARSPTATTIGDARMEVTVDPAARRPQRDARLPLRPQVGRPVRGGRGAHGLAPPCRRSRSTTSTLEATKSGPGHYTVTRRDLRRRRRLDGRGRRSRQRVRPVHGEVRTTHRVMPAANENDKCPATRDFCENRLRTELSQAFRH